jgi:hypothetical protein
VHVVGAAGGALVQPARAIRQLGAALGGEPGLSLGERHRRVGGAAVPGLDREPAHEERSGPVVNPPQGAKHGRQPAREKDRREASGRARVDRAQTDLAGRQHDQLARRALEAKGDLAQSERALGQR